jgi:hypothetical protein
VSYPHLAGMPSVSSGRCQAGIGADGANLGPGIPRFWRRRGHCDEPVTHRVSAGCVHEHVQSWEVCAGCASALQAKADSGQARHCTGCDPDHARCPIAIVVRELETAVRR